tara:strand:+ start:69 stop:329 length:261 start_codon:yes stop_codon:yes gene_type:complete
MEVTSNLDAPMGWRSRMALAETVDAGISFTGGLSSGYIGINRYQDQARNKNTNNTRPKQLPYLANNHNSGLNAIRVAGRTAGKIYS